MLFILFYELHLHDNNRLNIMVNSFDIINYRHYFSSSKLWPSFIGLYDRSGERWRGAQDHAIKKKIKKKNEEMEKDIEESESLHKAFFPIHVWPEQAK